MPDRTPTVRDVVALLDGRFDPGTAQAWDRVGLVLGDPDQPASSVLFAVDPLPTVVEQAVLGGYDLLVVHHPLLLRGAHSVSRTTAKGRAVHDLIAGDCALLTMHTNADAAVAGVNDALADAIEIAPSRRPIRAIPDGDWARLVCYVPADHADAVIAAVAGAGGGRLCDYDFCAYWVDGTGQFRPLPGADPHIGIVGSLERVPERRVEMTLPRNRTTEIVHALRSAHPYEEPAFSIVAGAELPGARGLGRIGSVAPVSLRALAERLAAALPVTAHGVRVAGDPGQVVCTVAVCGGAGDSLLGDVSHVGADAYVTSDLRHHPATEHRADGGPALVDISHWAGESLWLAAAAKQLQADAIIAGWALTTSVSARNTDPWTFRVDSPVASVSNPSEGA